MIMFLLIDNYDSFTYNLAQAFQALGKNPLVLKNDDPAILDLAKSPDLEMVCISPGPGHPANAGLCPQFLELVDPKVPVLGVCLGHQLLGLFGGAKVDVGPKVMHGKQSAIRHDGRGLFAGLPNPLKVGRYHSLVVEDMADAPFTITARGDDNEIMALRYKDRPWAGVQFHPESVLTPDGLRLLGNFPESLMAATGDDFGMPQALEALARGEDLDQAAAARAFDALLDGKLADAQAAAFLMGLRAKGESAVELAEAARAALKRAVKVDNLPRPSIDIVGTGGDGRNSFNCSTASALILAGMGYKVVKHGNRAVSSKCGAADALEGLGIVLEKDPAKAPEMLKKRNFAFLFAPHFHPGFKNIAPLRRQMGIRTLFNMLGPLINPAQPSHLLMGVARDDMIVLAAETLLKSGIYRACVICGAGGYDEITPIGPANCALVQKGEISNFTLDPARYGIKPCTQEDLAVHSREAAIAVLKSLLRGQGPAPMLDMLTLNVGMGIFLLEEGMEMDRAMELARQAVLDGAGQKVIENA